MPPDDYGEMNRGQPGCVGSCRPFSFRRKPDFIRSVMKSLEGLKEERGKYF